MKHKQQQGRTDATLGDYIRRRRKARGWTLDDAEAESNVDRTYWSKLELGVFKQPDPRYLARIADALDAPLEDVYALAGYTAAERLPGLTPYLRSKYHLPPEAIEQLESYFAFLRHQYGIPEGESVFPKKPERAARPKAEQPASEQRGGPWNDPTLSVENATLRRAA
ncbi:MAG TPA: helix-turn-helix transcriptional regulator [Acidimicrobiales bacterium]|nr:helix-turn-helix transcriptional regulator [Acidimicrobiales bacterium]